MCAKTIKINEGFICLHCQQKISPAEKTCRNHCNHCLYSLHVDGDVPGDRASECHGLMEPIRVERDKKGYMIVQHCLTCGHIRRNKTMPDDDWDTIIELSMQ